jgi:hypothetical protein
VAEAKADLEPSSPAGDSDSPATKPTFTWVSDGLHGLLPMQTVRNLCRPELMVRDQAGAASRLCGRGCERLRKDAQLLKQCEIVHQDATVFPSAVDNPVNDNAFHGDPPACRGGFP